MHSWNSRQSTPACFCNRHVTLKKTKVPLPELLGMHAGSSTEAGLQTSHASNQRIHLHAHTGL